jgi:hypothetical protein
MKRLVVLVAGMAFALACALAAAQKGPPLVLEPDKYSYTFGVPAGWDFSFEQARLFMVRVVLFPAGGDFRASKSVVYVNELCQQPCNAAAALERVVSNARTRNAALRVEAPPSLKTKGGTTVPVRVMTGFSDPRQVKEAVAFIETADVVILAVLTTSDASGWEKDYAALSAMIGGFQYFDCKSAEERLRC